MAEVDRDRIGASSAHYTAKEYARTVEATKDPSLQRYMQVEKEAITTGVADASSKTFVDLGAGYGRILPYISTIARNVIAIELNSDMFSELDIRARAYGNAVAILGDVANLPALLKDLDLNKPVILLLQNTLAVLSDPIKLLIEIREIAKRHGGEIIISVFKQEALESKGVPMYRTLQDMVGEVDLDKIDYREGRFVSKTGYISKWWKAEERKEIKETVGGRVVKIYEEDNFWILHVSLADQTSDGE